MNFANKIIWSEGMFLQPHHLQQQDTYIEQLLNEKLRMIMPYYWGITELEIDEQLLSLGKFSVKSCQGILPDGTLFNIPHRDKAPIPIEIPLEATNCIIYIGVPFKCAGVAEIDAKENSSQQAYRYRVETVEVSDSNSGSDVTALLQVAKLNLQLAHAEQEAPTFCRLGIARILEVRSDRKLILDKSFLPPCLNVHAIVEFSGFVQELLGLLRYRSEVLRQRLGDPGAGGVAEITDFILLQLVNRFEALLTHFTQISYLHPEQLYRTLIQLIGELSLLLSKDRQSFAQPIYLHEQLQQTFAPIMLELRRALSAVLEENTVFIKLEERQLGVWVAIINDKPLLEKSTFILSVQANLPQDMVRKDFPTHCKAAPVEEIRNLIHRALPGIELSALAVVPRQLPYHANSIYFTLNTHHPFWQSLKLSAGLAFHVSGNFPGLRIELWAIKDK